jgi:hypothetical protein
MLDEETITAELVRELYGDVRRSEFRASNPRTAADRAF